MDRRVIVVAVLPLVLVAACTGGDPGAAPEQSGATPQASGAPTDPPTGAAGSETAQATESPSPDPTDPALPNNCGEVLLTTAVTQALGVRFEGETTYLRTAPDEASGRLGRVTCDYGVETDDDGVESSPVLSASVIAYPDADEALRRVDATVTRALGAGSTVEDVALPDNPDATAFLLSSQDSATVVAARGQYTFVIAAEVLGVDVGDDGEVTPAANVEGLQELLTTLLANTSAEDGEDAG
jgi:hypothetical protein